MTKSTENLPAKFTPGPWRVFCLKQGQYRILVEMFGGNNYVASCMDRYNWSGRAKENAQLIAAAPDMYESLVGLLKLMRACGIDQDGYGFVDRAKLAIEKAEGNNIKDGQ